MKPEGELLELIALTTTKQTIVNVRGRSTSVEKLHISVLVIVSNFVVRSRTAWTYYIESKTLDLPRGSGQRC